MDMRRLTLRAALLKLIEGVEVPKNVLTCYENMASIFAEVDSVRHAKRRSEGTDWTKKALEYANLTRLGNFSVMVTTKKNTRVITFTEGNNSIEFIFEHAPKKSVDRLGPMMDLTKGQSQAEQQAIVNAFVQGAVEESLLKKRRSHEEILLGDKPLSLDEYQLKCVQRLEPHRSKLKFMRFFRQNMIIYTAP
jgi:hypothetical protein